MGGIREPTPADQGRTTSRSDAIDLLYTDADFEDERQAQNYVHAAFRNGRREKYEVERDWHQNLQFYMNNQWITWRRGTGSWQPAPTMKHRVRYKANLVAPYVMTRTARYIKDEPKIQVLPATGEPQDAEIAQNATRVMRYAFQARDVKGRVLPLFLNNCFLMGTGILKCFWNPSLGPKMAFDDSDLEDSVDTDSGEVKGPISGKSDREAKASSPFGTEYSIGDVDVESVSPMHIYPDPSADNWDDIDWLIDARRFSLDKIRNMWPEKGALVRDITVEPSDQPEYFRDLLRGYSGLYPETFSALNRNVPSAYIYEFWLKPNRKYPKGWHIVVGGDTVLVNEPLPKWCGGELPYVFMVDRKVTHRIWGSPIADDLRDINKVRNRAMGQIIENGNLIGNPPILNPVGSKIKGEDFQGRPGAIWNYMPTASGDKPEYSNAPPLPAYVQQLPSMLESDSMVVTGINETTARAAAPSNVRTASGLAALMKTDESRQAVNLQMFSSALSHMGKKMLTIVAVNYTEERMVRVSGEKWYSSFLLTGSDLIGENWRIPGVSYFDVSIVVEPGHRSKDAFRQEVLNMAQMGLFDLADETMRRRVWRLLDVGSADDSVFGDMVPAEAQAIAESLWMAMLDDDDLKVIQAERRLGPHDWDDHEVHISSHTEYMQRAEFLRLPSEVWLRFQAHINEHKMLLQAQQAEMAPPPEAQQGPPPAQTPSTPGPQPAQPPGRRSLPGQPEQPNQAQEPNLEQSQFAGLNL